MKRFCLLLLLLLTLLSLCVLPAFADDDAPELPPVTVGDDVPAEETPDEPPEETPDEPPEETPGEPPEETPVGFTDIESHWAREDILRAQALGLVNGVTQTEYAPDLAMTRAMFVTILYRLDGSPAELSEGAAFLDVPEGAFYTDAVRWASGNGIVNGVTAELFAPDLPCTREQAVTLLRRYLLYLNREAQERSFLAYADAWQLGDYARVPMQWAVAAGLIKGMDKDRIAPKSEITRAQFAALAVRFTEYLAGELPAPEPAAAPGPVTACATGLVIGAQNGGTLGQLGTAYYVSLRQLAAAFGGVVSEPQENSGIATVTLTLFGRFVRFSDGFADARTAEGSFDLGTPALPDGEDWQIPVRLFDAVYGRALLMDPAQDLLRCTEIRVSSLNLHVNGNPVYGVITLDGLDCTPLDYLSAALGGGLSATSWDGVSTVTLSVPGHTMILHSGSVEAILDGWQLTLPQPALFDGVTWFAPARAAAEALGCTVVYDAWTNRMDCGFLQNPGTVLWIDGRQFPVCLSLLQTVYVPLEDLCALCGGTMTAQDGALRLSVFGHTLELAENSSALRLDGAARTMSAAVFRSGAGLLAPVKSLAEALGFTELADTAWNQLFYTKIVKNNALPRGYSVPVLMYHAVSDDIWGIRELFVSPKNLEAQIKAMLDAGCTPITFEDLDHVDKIRKPVLLTFDDGYRDNYTNLFPLLKKYNVKATIFMITGSIGTSRSLTEAQIKEMSASGLVSFQSHTVSHDYLDTMSTARLETEMRDSMWRLTRLTGKQPFVLCYPTGRSNATARQIAAKYYEYGLNMSGSRFVTGSTNPFQICRYYVSRDTSVSSVLSYVR